MCRIPSLSGRALTMAALLLLAAGPQAAEPAAPVTVSINFHDAPLSMVLSYLAAITEKTVVAAPGVNGTVILRTQGRIPQSEAIDLIEGYLVMLGLAVIDTGASLKVVPIGDAHHAATGIVDYEDAPPRDTAQGILTRRFHLKSLTTAQAVQLVKPIMHPNGVAQALDPAPALLVTDTAPNLRRMKTLLDDAERSAAAPRSGGKP